MRFLFCLILAISATTMSGANWPQWRGPDLNGSSPEKGLPAEWSTNQNVLWRSALPGYSGATPVIWEDTVFVSSPDPDKNLLLLAFDAKTGAEKWRKVVGTGDREKGLNNMASPSPVTDGKSVFVMFGTGDVAAYDFAGKQLWARNLAAEHGKFSINWIYGSSPLLHKDRLYIQVLQHDPPSYPHARDDKPTRESYLLCLDPKTGKDIWRHVRPTDAKSEAQESYTTPVPYEGANGTEIIVLGGNYATSHAAGTGEEIWRCGGLNDRKELYWRIVPSAVVADDMIIVSGPKRDPVLGIKAGGKGLITATHIAWRFKENPTDCVTPLLYQGKLFVLDGDRQVMTCLAPKTGEKLWQGNLGVGREIFRASPLGADGRIYCIGENGTAVVLDAGDQFKILSTVPMGEKPVRSSMAAANGRLFIRTAKNLYCIGKP